MDEIDLSIKSVLSLLDCGPFVGREMKMGRLMETYARVQEGQTRIMSIKGESGIGKTRMATEFLDWAEVQGATVLRGRAFENGERWPYQLLVEMLEQHREQSMREKQVQDTILDPLDELRERVLMEMRTYMLHQSAESGQGKTEYRRLFASFTLLGQALAEQTPLVLFIDDIHWSDFASLEMLQYAGRRWIESHTPILMLFSLRTEALVMLPNFASWLAYLEHDLYASGFILNPLMLEDTIGFVLALAVEETIHLEGFGRWLYTETSGQAFYMVELLKMLFEHGLLRARKRRTGGWGIDFEPLAGNIGALERLLLPGVRAVIVRRLKQLSPPACVLAAAGAVLGRNVPFEYLRSVANFTEQEAWEALNELLRRHIFCEEAGYYFFTHEKVREVVYAEIAGTQRIKLHTRALELLRIEAMPISFHAYHARAASLDEEAFRLYVAAGDVVMRHFALRDAVTFYERAFHLLMEQQVQEGACADLAVSAIEHLYLQAGHIYELLNEREHAWATYQSMFLLARRMNVTLLISIALSQLAIVTRHEIFDAQEQARMLFQEEIDTVVDLVTLAENAWQLAQFNFYRFDAEGALQHGGRALQLAREVGSPELIARTLSTFVSTLMLTGAWEEVEALAEEARVFYQMQRDTVMEATCLVQIAQVRFHQGQPQEGLIAARTAHLAFEQAEYNWGKIYVAHHLVTGLLDIGAYEEALALAQNALTQAREYNVALLLCLCLMALGRVQRTLMNSVAAYALHNEAMSVFSTDVPRPVMEMLFVELCADCVLAGAWADAQSYATQALSYRSNSTFLYVGLTCWYETEILVRTGYSERATADTERFGHMIGQSRRYRIPYLRSLAVLALWRGEFEQTHCYLQEAKELAEQIGLPGEVWSIEATRGELYLAQGNKAGAHSAIEHASEIVQTLAEGIEDEQTRAKFLAVQQVQRIIDNTRVNQKMIEISQAAIHADDTSPAFVDRQEHN